jgi:hypothetical protein
MALQIVINTLTVIGGGVVFKTFGEQLAKAQNKAYDVHSSNAKLRRKIYTESRSGSEIERRIEEINCSPVIDISHVQVKLSELHFLDKLVWHIVSPLLIPFTGISLARQSFIQWKIKRIEREWKNQLLDELLRDAKKIK